MMEKTNQIILKLFCPLSSKMYEKLKSKLDDRFYSSEKKFFLVVVEILGDKAFLSIEDAA